MSKTKEQLVNDFALAVRVFEQARINRDGRHQDYREALAKCQNAEAALTDARKALHERMTDQPKAAQVGQPGGPFGPKLPPAEFESGTKFGTATTPGPRIDKSISSQGI